MPSQNNIRVLTTPSAPVALPTLFKALGDTLRVRVLRVLKEGSLNVTELCDVFQTGQSALSHHLKVLVSADLLTRRKEGTVTFYRRQIPEGDHARLVNEALASIDAQPLDATLEQGLARVQAERELNSRAFFADNSAQFREHQELIASWDDYAQATLHLLDRHCSGPHLRLLEVGPGDGQLLPALAARAGEVVGLDNSEAMLARARLITADLANVQLEHGELHSYSQEGAGFDGAIVNMVLHHTPSPQQTLREAAALLRPGGVMVVSELCAHDQDWAREACGDLWLGFEPAQLTTWAGQAGLASLAELFIAQRNGFQIQVRLFERTTADYQ